MTIHVCYSHCIARWRRILKCPRCERRTRHIVEDEAWYGFRVTCCSCGRMHQDGFATRDGVKSHQKRAKEARAKWADGPFDGREEYWEDYSDES